ncbi:Poly(A) RNA polymerase gld-2-like protein B [Diplonema papillatum]|nr:Poly(A) RNA polymerase gld-2-like protein B [Diplonema papillatum]
MLSAASRSVSASRVVRRWYSAVRKNPRDAKAAIDTFFVLPEKWSDPWTPCLMDAPPSPRDLDTTVDWSESGNHVVTATSTLTMSKERFEEAMDVRAKIESCLRRELAEQSLQVFTLGSCMSGLGTQTSDLDLVIMRSDDSGKSLNPLTREEQKRYLDDYEMMLKDNGFTHLRIIQARVPILRREGPEGINFDISLLFHGVRNSILLREYARSCPFFMPMSTVLREWGKHIGVCNSLQGYLTPYCVNIMIIKYLAQEVSEEFHVPVPPLLPPSYYPTYPSQYLPLPREVQNREAAFVKDLGTHLAGFLLYYACYDYNDKVVSAVEPWKDSRAESTLWQGCDADVIIEEMFSQQDKSLPIPNMSQKVDAMRLLSIREKFMYSYLHVVKHGYLPADPEDQKSAMWKPYMQQRKLAYGYH